MKGLEDLNDSGPPSIPGYVLEIRGSGGTNNEFKSIVFVYLMMAKHIYNTGAGTMSSVNLTQIRAMSPFLLPAQLLLQKPAHCNYMTF